MPLHRISCFIALLLLTACAGTSDEKMDVDLSDSMSFEEFHQDKKDAVKLWEDKTPEKTYQENTQSSAGDAPAAATAAVTTAAPASAVTKTEDKKGKRYEIRELYSISGSERTGYTPTTVVQALYLQMQGLCPNGWKKLDERSQPDGSDAYYMYYSFECL